MSTPQEHPSGRVIAISPAPADGEGERVSLYQAHQKIYPRSVQGVFAQWRWLMVAITQLVFYGLPWIEWGQRQAVLFDLGARRFYIFGLVLYPQDFIYLTALLVISALSLFCSRLWRVVCGAVLPARKRCTARFSSGSSVNLKATDRPDCGWMPRLGASISGLVNPANNWPGWCFRCGQASALWAISPPFAS